MEERVKELENRVADLERRVALWEEDAARDDERNRRARAFNMWIRIGVYAAFLVLMVLALVVLKVRF